MDIIGDVCSHWNVENAGIVLINVPRKVNHAHSILKAGTTAILAIKGCTKWPGVGGVIAMDSLDLGKMIEKDQQELNELIDNSLQ